VPEINQEVESLRERPEIEMRPRPYISDGLDDLMFGTPQLSPEKVDVEISGPEVILDGEATAAHLKGLCDSLLGASTSTSPDAPLDANYLAALGSLDRAALQMLEAWEHAALYTGDIPRLVASDLAYSVTYLSNFLASLSPEIREMHRRSAARDAEGFTAYAAQVQYLDRQIRETKKFGKKVDAAVELMTLEFQEEILDSLLAGLNRRDIAAASSALKVLRAALYVSVAGKVGAWKVLSKRIRSHLRQQMRREILLRVWREMDQCLDRFRFSLTSSGPAFVRLARIRGIRDLLDDAVDGIYRLKRKRDALVAGLWAQDQAMFDLLDERLEASKFLGRAASTLRVLDQLIDILDAAAQTGRLPQNLKVRVLNRLRKRDVSTDRRRLNEAASEPVTAPQSAGGNVDTEARVGGWSAPGSWRDWDWKVGF